MSQRHMSKIVLSIPDSLRTRIGRNLPAAAAAWNAEKAKVLGVQGSATDRSKPGSPPRRQTGVLEAGTRAIPAASKLEITIVTTAVGKILNKTRPFINKITRQSSAARQAALHKP